MSVFDELLAIKRFREEKAEMAVAKQRQTHAESQEAIERAREELTRFCAWALQREREMYGDLCSRVVRVREIEDVMQGVAGLRAGERQQEARVDAAVAQEQREAQTLAERRQSHRDATRMTEKFVELAQAHLAEFLKEAERKEDLEMEEAASVARDKADWEQHEEYEPS